MKNTMKRILAVAICVVMTLTAAPLGGFAGLNLSDLFSIKASALDVPECPYGDNYYDENGESHRPCYESNTPHCHCKIVNDEAVVCDFVWYSNWYGGSEAHPAHVEIHPNHHGYPVTTIGYEVFSCHDTTSITIPDTVKRIETRAFLESKITNIKIPDSVTYIGYAAFAKCDGLTSIEISGNGATVIEDRAFNSCANLTDVTIGDGVTTIGEYAFGECDKLKNLTIGNNVKSIGKNAFEFCTGLIDVSIPDSVTTLCEQAFYSCSSLESVTIGNGVTSISDGTFSECTNLKDVTFGKNVTVIGKSAFYYCENLKDITIPDSVTVISERAFSCCKGLENVSVPEGVTTIEGWAFNNCTSLKNIEITEGVTVIGSCAFSYCESLTKVEIPASVESIGVVPFIGCKNLELITVDKNNENYSSDGGVLFNKDRTFLVEYPMGSKRANYKIPDGVIEIGESAFELCEGLEYIHIPESVSKIGRFAFSRIGDTYLCSTLEDGYVKEYAEVNGKTYVVCHHSEHAHTPVTKTTPATCTEDGVETVECEECGAVISKKVIPAKGHTAGDWEVADLATCTENGRKVKNCVDCGEFMQSEPIIALGHVPGEWVIIKPATTATTGIKAQKCANCSEVLLSEDIPVLVAKVHDVSISDSSLNYKSSLTIAPVIVADEGVSYTVTYSSSDPDVVTVDENGNINAMGKGTAEITVTVTDENGNVVSDTCEVEVKYKWWQWIIVIVLFGWIWY